MATRLSHPRNAQHAIRITYYILLVALLTSCALPFASKPTLTPTPTVTLTITTTPTLTLTSTLTPTSTPTPLPADAIPAFILSLSDNGYAHLFVYSPEKLAPTRLTNGHWDDIAPALSPDGTKVAFASNRNDYWDLYLLDLTSGQTSRLTDTLAYDNNPSWSPDSQWLTYETYIDDNLEINVLSITNPGQTIRLTDDPAQDQEPAWSPLGRQIAFVSNRSGDEEIWLASLDQTDEGRFINLSNSPFSAESHPDWSPDGTKLAWAASLPNEPDSLFVYDNTQEDATATRFGTGDWPNWNDSSDHLATRLSGPNGNYLIGYALDGTFAIPMTPLPLIHGLDWRVFRIGSLPYTFKNAASLTATPLWNSRNQAYTDIPGQRGSVVELPDVEAPHPYLLDDVDEAFTGLRERLIAETGWDVLASLENAYVPLTSTLDPGRGQDWLFTGRAFALNPLTLNAGWMVLQREDFNEQTYWRIFLRALAQDGSQGEPLHRKPWDLNARYSLDPQAYEQGGAPFKTIPSGYWVDFTALAHEYGWRRIPSLGNWRAYFGGTQFNEYILTGGLDWRTAMLKLYPEDIFTTPTVVIPPTRTATSTPKGYRYKTPTPTRTFTPTPRPTFTP